MASKNFVGTFLNFIKNKIEFLQKQVLKCRKVKFEILI